MKINLLKNYGGSRTKEQRILPGVYHHTDKELFGLADYLVENGHAVVVDPPSVNLDIGVDGVRGDEMTAVINMTVTEGITVEAPVEAITVKVAQEDVDILRAEVQEVAEEIAANLEEIPKEVLEEKPKRGRRKKQ